MSVIKELKGGFKNYIPLALCTHKACQTATRTTDPFDTEIGWTEKGEMRLKQRSMSAAKDHYITTDDFTEIRENFIRGIRRYLVMNEEGEEPGPGGERAIACADMFMEFFSVIAARPGYTQDWPSYRGYIIQTYTSWVGRRDDQFGLVFDEHVFFQYKMDNLLPNLVDQLRQPSTAVGTPVGNPGNTRGGSGARGRGRGFLGRGGYSSQSFPSSSGTLQPQAALAYRCFLCNGNHSHKDHQGPATRLIPNEQGKWVDKSHGSKIVCISFNVGSAGCKRGLACTYSHSCSLCGDIAHGSSKCIA